MSKQSNKQSKVAVVTGASRGIGAAIARRLSQDGFAVVAGYAEDDRGARALVEEIERGGRSAVAIRADVSVAAAFRQVFDLAELNYGGVDVLVNNAGIMDLAPIAETLDEAFDRQVAINLKGTFNGLRESAKRLRDGGRIVNLSSSVVGMFQPTYAVYAATKAGVEAMTSVFAKELRGRNITVNAVAPGPVGTELFLKDKPQEIVDRIAKAAPLERLGRPEDIAGVVSFLAGPDGAWVHGQVLRANGGII